MHIKHLSKDLPLKGVLYACAAFGLFAFMAMLNKLVAGQHGAIEVSFYRNMTSLTPFLLYLLFTRRYEILQVRRPKLLAFRSVVGTLGLYATFAAAQILPLSYATALFFVSTLILPVIAALFLKETIGKHRITAVVVGMVGVLIVVQPSGEISMIGVVIALLAGLSHAIVQASLRGLRDEDPNTITFYFFSTVCVVSGLLMPFVYDPPTLKSLMIMAAIGLTGIGGQMFLVRAFKYAQASLVSPFSYTGLIWAALFDVVIWQVWPEMSVWLGASIIIGASLYIVYRENLKKKDG